jgi:2-iminobutanoate/2-iminopropanoate deaminase
MNNHSKTAIATPDAPPALGPYSQGIRVGDTIYVSGQLPLDPKSGQIVAGDITEQTERVLLNIREILEEGEASLSDVVKVTIYLKDLGNFAEVNRVYAMFFPNTEHNPAVPPARSTVEVSRLPREAEIEMDAIAVVMPGYVDPEVY